MMELVACDREACRLQGDQFGPPKNFQIAVEKQKLFQMCRGETQIKNPVITVKICGTSQKNSAVLHEFQN